MTIWTGSRAEFSAVADALLQYAAPVESRVAEADEIAGYCLDCRRVGPLQVAPGTPAGSWRNLLEGMICACTLNGRSRLTLAVLDELLKARRFGRAAVLERLTPFYARLEKRLAGLIGSEYLGEGHAPGSTGERDGVRLRSESMMALSYGSGSLDLVMHFDVLEHVPDWRLGLRECWRVLAPGGVMLCTFPFYDRLDRNIVRAEWLDGSIVQRMPPAYHGDPLSTQGSLVFIHPSWEIHEFMLGLGFASVEMALCYDLAQGILSNGCPFPEGHMWPVVFVATK